MELAKGGLRNCWAMDSDADLHWTHTDPKMCTIFETMHRWCVWAIVGLEH